MKLKILSKHYFYHCGYCGGDFDTWLKEDLKGVVVRCIYCDAFLKAREYYKVKWF